MSEAVGAVEGDAVVGPQLRVGTALRQEIAELDPRWPPLSKAIWPKT